MIGAPGRLALIAGLGVLALLSGSGAMAATLKVEVDGIEPGGGPVRVALCQGGLSEPFCTRGDEAPASGGRASFTFQDVAPGPMRWRPSRMPTATAARPDRARPAARTYGFSGAVARRGRPDFSDAAFALQEPGAAVRVRLARALPRR